MDNYIQIKNVKIGDGIPKICVPIVEEKAEQIISEAKAIKDLPCDIVEWRLDWFEKAFDIESVMELLADLRGQLGAIPLLFTFRTMAEGGNKEIDLSYYERLNRSAINSGLIDLVDVELFAGDDVVKDMVKEAGKNDVYTIVSNHDFESTPGKDEIVSRLIKMHDLGADIPKIAVMPHSRDDVLRLLQATTEARDALPSTPIITMSMGKLGLISRLSGEAFGSAITFGSARQASAPGQMKASELSTILSLIHDYM